MIFSKFSFFIAVRCTIIHESVLQLKKKIPAKQNLTGILISFGVSLIGRSGNLSEITVELVPVQHESSIFCTNRFFEHLKKLSNKTKKLAKTEYVQIPMFGRSCFLNSVLNHKNTWNGWQLFVQANAVVCTNLTIELMIPFSWKYWTPSLSLLNFLNKNHSLTYDHWIN